MEKHQDTSCGCRSTAEESDQGCTSSHCDAEVYACDKFKDPGWMKINIDYFPSGFEAPSGIFKNIPPREADKMLRESDGRYRILDVKTEEEYCRLHLAGSLNLDFFSPNFKDDLFSMDKEDRYIVICKIGMRSEITMNLMKKMGFREVYNVTGGDDRWTDEEIPYTEYEKTGVSEQVFN